MNVIHYRPWGLMQRSQRDVDRLLSARPAAAPHEDDRDRGSWLPAVDVREERDRLVIRADLPGVSSEDLEVTMDGGHLVIRGQRDTEVDASQDGWRRVERISGRFCRRIALPATADSDCIEAAYTDGVLEIIVPKQAKSLPRRIEINAS